MTPPEDLLRPSLSDNARVVRRSIHSPMVGYLSGFFGGPVAAAIVAMVNSFRLGRLRTDWPLALVVVLLVMALLRPAPFGVADRLDDWLGSSGARMAWRLSGLAVFFGFYQLHGRYHRGMQVMGIKAPSGWAVGILATLTGGLVLVLASLPAR